MISNLGIVDTKKIIAAIKDSYGLDLTNYTLTTLRHRFIYILNNLNINTVDDFVRQVKRNNVDFDAIEDYLMIETTEFFRDPSFWREMREKYLPDVAKTVGSKIWLAGITSGEELFSLMILLKELGLSNEIKILVSCASKRSVERIKNGGGYLLKRMELGEANYTRFSGTKDLSKYYTVSDNRAYLDSDLLKGVEFNTLNISQDNNDKIYRMIIFRNVMIKYNLPLYEKVTRRLIDSLNFGGYLIIGNKETFDHSEVAKKFLVVVNDSEKIYKKKLD